MRCNFGRITCVLVVVAAALSACRSGLPKEVRERADPGVTFESVFSDPESNRGKMILWGGVVVGTRNTPEGAVLEVIDYPLDHGDRPRTDRKPDGRFLILHDGFLDPAVYGAGREITVVGEIMEPRSRALDDIEYRYPVVKEVDLVLWGARSPGPRFHFGIGATIVR